MAPGLCTWLEFIYPTQFCPESVFHDSLLPQEGALRPPPHECFIKQSSRHVRQSCTPRTRARQRPWEPLFLSLLLSLSLSFSLSLTLSLSLSLSLSLLFSLSLSLSLSFFPLSLFASCGTRAYRSIVSVPVKACWSHLAPAQSRLAETVFFAR